MKFYNVKFYTYSSMWEFRLLIFKKKIKYSVFLKIMKNHKDEYTMCGLLIPFLTVKMMLTYRMTKNHDLSLS